jgi:hypothetical protein
MKIKLNDWVEHAVFGIGQVFENRGEKLGVRFVNSGEKTLIKSAPIWPLTAPSVATASGISRRRVMAKTASRIQNCAND